MVRLRSAIVAVTVFSLVPCLAAAQPPKAGIVTTLEGNVTAARAAAPQPVSLKFKDDVFLQDKITTAEQSLARMLLGGKAVVTVRERSSLTITEIPGRSTIAIDSGKFALVVARERMQPGEVIEIRTPNAIAAVRGTVVVTEVESPPLAPPPQVVSNLYVLRGSLEDAQPVDPSTGARIGTPRIINVLEQFRVVGLVGVVLPITPGQLGAIRAGLQPKSQQHTAAANQDEVSAQAVQTAVGLATTLTGTPTAFVVPTPQPQTSTPEPTVTVAPIIPPVAEEKEFLDAASTGTVSTAGSLLTNPGFETGDFSGWSLSGAGAVITQFGNATIFPPEGKSMALIHTNTGTILSGCGSGNDCTKSTLSQSFNVTSIVTLQAEGAFLSNEFPSFTGSGSGFKDKYVIQLVDSSGQTFTLFETDVNALHNSFTATSSSFSAGTFTLSAGAGEAEFTLGKKTITPAKGTATLTFSVSNVSDSVIHSAFIIDAVVLTQDPPLHFVDAGGLSVPGGAPLLSLTHGGQSFDSLLVVCCSGSVVLSGPALRARNGSLDVQFSLIGALQGGNLTSTWPGAMVELEGGSYNLGDFIGVFNVAGAHPADQTLVHGGTFLDATDATVKAGAVMVVDSALVAATAPLLNLKNSTFVSKDHALDMAYRANVTSLGPLFSLNASTLTVNNGALVNLGFGSTLTVNGHLIQLSNGSTLSLLNGPLAKVAGNSALNVSGALVSFSGAGNSVNITNSLCSSFSCANVGGLNVALTGGASTANVSITNPVKGSGTIATSGNAAAILVSGSGSKVTIAGQ